MRELEPMISGNTLEVGLPILDSELYARTGHAKELARIAG